MTEDDERSDETPLKRVVGRWLLTLFWLVVLVVLPFVAYNLGVTLQRYLIVPVGGDR